MWFSHAQWKCLSMNNIIIKYVHTELFITSYLDIADVTCTTWGICTTSE